jgi:hypothetical protein
VVISDFSHARQQLTDGLDSRCTRLHVVTAGLRASVVLRVKLSCDEWTCSCLYKHE